MKKLVVLRKAKYNDTCKVEIVTNEGTAKESFIPLLEQLKFMGDIGASRSIKIDDWKREEKEAKGKDSFYMDGDGYQSIKEINYIEVR